MFPFNIDDLAYFVIRRKDGLTIRYNIVKGSNVSNITTLVKANDASDVKSTVMQKKTYSEWCHHNPASEPLFSSKTFDLYIADAFGFRQHYKEYDIAIDCGSVLTMYQVNNKPTLFSGDALLRAGLEDYVIPYNLLDPKILQIDWDDRRAPRLNPDFWADFVTRLSGTVLICCQGGHGRSGTGAVCMMMALNPEYTPADAIIHLRAVHCARAIESKEQHEYIGVVGEALGRVNDIERIGKVNSFKDEFFAMKHPSAKPYQDRLRAAIEKGEADPVDKKQYQYEFTSY